MQATLGFKLSYLLTILTAAVLWWGPMHSSDNFFTRIKKYSSSSLAFTMLNLVAAAIFLSTTKSNLPPLVSCQLVVEGVNEGTAIIDDGNQDKGDFDACTPLALMEGHKQVDPAMHKDSDGGSVCYDENSGCDGTDDGNNNNDDDDDDDDEDDDGDDDDDIDPIDLQKRSQEFIDKTIHGWIAENRRDGLMYQP